MLTPHYGEAARLLSALGTPITKREVAAAPLHYARALHEATGCHIVLKGPVTIVYSYEYVDLGAEDSTHASPHFVRVYEPTVNTTTTSWAGVAGSGDVLAGLIAGVLARPLAPRPGLEGPDGRPQYVTSARISAAVMLHARAAERIGRQYTGDIAMQASDIAREIPRTAALRCLSRVRY